MATVKINKGNAMSDDQTASAVPSGQTPSQELVRNALQEKRITDSAGREIVLRKPSPLAQYRLVEAAGASASNQTYMQMVLPLVYVSSIDGNLVPGISTKQQLEALIQRLDEHGINAVMNAVMEFYGQQDPDADKERLKN